MSIAHFQTHSGHCEITEDEVRITKNRTISLRRKIENKRKATLLIVISTAIFFSMAWYRTSVTRALLAVGVFVVAPAIGIYIIFELFKFVRWKIAKRRRDTPEGGFVFAGNIPRSRVESVGFSRNSKGGAIAVNFEQDGAMTSGVMRFAGDERLERAKTAFQTAGMPIEEA